MTKASEGAFGASMGARTVRVTLTDNGRVIDSASIPVGNSSDPVLAAAVSAFELANRWGHEYPVLAIDGAVDDPYAVDGVRLTPQSDAYLSATRATDAAAGARVVSVVDVGASGTRAHVLDTLTGEVYATSATAEVGGDVWDALVVDHLLTTYGAREAITPQSTAVLEADATITKELLSTERAVDLTGPFLSESVRLRRNVFEDLIAPSLQRLAAFATADLEGVEVILLVGGGAYVPAVLAALSGATDLPIVVPEHPELFAAIGAAGLESVLPVRVPLPVNDFQDFGDDEVTPAFGSPVIVPIPNDPSAYDDYEPAYEAYEPVAYEPEAFEPVAYDPEPYEPQPREPADREPADREPVVAAAIPKRRGRRARIAAYAGTCAAVAVGVVLSLTVASGRTSAVDHTADDNSVAPSSIAGVVPTVAVVVSKGEQTTTTAPTTTSTTTTTSETTTTTTTTPETTTSDRPDPRRTTTTAAPSTPSSSSAVATTTERPVRTPDRTTQAPTTPPVTTSSPAATTSSTPKPATTTPKPTK